MANAYNGWRCRRDTPRQRDGKVVGHGSIFYEPSTLSHTQHFKMELKRKIASNHSIPSSHIEELRNRWLLYWTMSKAGFANYPY